MVDVVIVGAGAAGLAAASALLRAKKRPLIVEASHRIGGRAYTDRSAFGLPFDRGCKWLHSASRNPWTKIADELGYDYLEGAADILVWSGRRFEDEQSKAKLFSYVQACWEAAERAAGKGQDRPLSEVMPKGSVLEERFFEHWCTVINGVPTKQTSTLDQARFVDTEENWPVVQGYGALIHTYGRALPVHLGVRVEAVHHKGRSVEVHTNRGKLRAKAVIVTVSTGVLAKEVIRFFPELPWPVRDAIHRLPMGKSNKAALLFHKDLFGLPDRAYLHFLPKLAPALDLDFEKRGKRVVVTGHFAGALSDRLEGREMVGALKSALVELFGSGVIRFCKRSVCTAWGKDPLFFGAYSAAAPGGAAGRQTLATPVDERVIFAGEATSTDAYATAHGAYQSGVRAASFCLSAC